MFVLEIKSVSNVGWRMEIAAHNVFLKLEFRLSVPGWASRYMAAQRVVCIPTRATITPRLMIQVRILEPTVQYTWPLHSLRTIQNVLE